MGERGEARVGSWRRGCCRGMGMGMHIHTGTEMKTGWRMVRRGMHGEGVWKLGSSVPLKHGHGHAHTHRYRDKDRLVGERGNRGGGRGGAAEVVWELEVSVLTEHGHRHAHPHIRHRLGLAHLTTRQAQARLLPPSFPALAATEGERVRGGARRPMQRWQHWQPHAPQGT